MSKFLVFTILFITSAVSIAQSLPAPLSNGSEPENQYSPAANSAAEKYEATEKVLPKLFLAGYKEFGFELRTSAMLRACNMKALAQSIASSGMQRVEFLAAQVMQMRKDDADNKAFLNSLTSDEIMSLITTANDQLSIYGLGYMDAIDIAKAADPRICQAGENAAEKVLERRNAKK